MRQPAILIICILSAALDNEQPGYIYRGNPIPTTTIVHPLESSTDK